MGTVTNMRVVTMEVVTMVTMELWGGYQGDGNYGYYGDGY